MARPPKQFGIDGFNRLSERQRMHLLFEVCSSPIWARRVLRGGPFRDEDALLDRADRVLAELPDAEVDSALDGHPRIEAKAANLVRRVSRHASPTPRSKPNLLGRIGAMRTSSATSTWCVPAAGPPRSCWPSSPTGSTTIPSPNAP